MTEKTADQIVAEILALRNKKQTLATARQQRELAKALLNLLPQGEGSGLDADMVDGLHADEIVEKALAEARKQGFGGGGGAVNHTHALDHPFHEDVNIGTPTEGQMLLYNATSGKWENGDPLVTVNREGTPTRINTTSAAQIVAAPGAGKALILCGFFLSVDADETVQLRWDGASGDIIVELPTKGVIGANLLGIAEQSPTNKNLYLTKSGSGNARGTVWTKEVTV